MQLALVTAPLQPIAFQIKPARAEQLALHEIDARYGDIAGFIDGDSQIEFDLKDDVSDEHRAVFGAAGPLTITARHMYGLGADLGAAVRGAQLLSNSGRMGAFGTPGVVVALLQAKDGTYIATDARAALPGSGEDLDVPGSILASVTTDDSVRDGGYVVGLIGADSFADLRGPASHT